MSDRLTIVEAPTSGAAPRSAADELVGAGVPQSDWVANVVSPALVVDQEGTPQMYVGRYSGDLARVRWAMMHYPMNSTVRAVGIRNRSNVFGYSARHVVMQRNACRTCNGANDAPLAHAVMCSAGAVMADMLGEVLPEIAEHDFASARDAILPDWILPDCWWTSGVLNLTSPLPYHYDRNNLDTWSAMIVARRGVLGGHLHVPELGIVVDCRDGDVVYFPGWHYVHGVTPMEKTERSSYRYSAVFYTVSKMAGCLPPGEEVERGRRDRTHREGDLRSADERLGK